MLPFPSLQERGAAWKPALGTGEDPRIWLSGDDPQTPNGFYGGEQHPLGSKRRGRRS